MGACIHAPWPWPRGDQKMRERQRQTATKPRYYIRGIEITAISGLGRFGSLGLLALLCAGARRPGFYRSASRPSISPMSRRSARKQHHRTDGEALEAVGVVSLPTARPKVALLCAALVDELTGAISCGAVHVGQLGTLGRGRSRPDTSASWGLSVEAGHVDQLGTLGRGRTRRPGRRPSPPTCGRTD